MKFEKVSLVYFSPTQTTQKTLRAIASAFDGAVQEYDITTSRDIAVPAFGAGDLVLVGVPVYGGRIPAIIETFIQSLKGEGAVAVAVGVYGNRHYDDAMLELADCLKADGFQLAGAGAFVAEHSFGTEVATGRPDAEDLAKAKQFGQQLFTKLDAAADLSAIAEPEIPGNRPYKERNAAANTAAPKTTDACIQCGVCVAACPVGIIDAEDPSKITDVSKCQRCFSCVKKCPVQAKFFDAEGVLKAMNFLKTNFSARREPELFL